MCRLGGRPSAVARGREGARVRGEFVHREERHHQPAVGDAGGARDPGGHLRADEDRGRGCWRGRGWMPTSSSVPVAPVVRHAILGPEAADDLDTFGEAAHALGHRHLEDGELFGPVAESDAEHEAPAGDHVHEGGGLGQLDRVVERQQDQVRPDPQPLDLGRQALEHRQERKVVEPWGDVMLPSPDRVEPQAADQPRLLDRLGEAARGVVAGRVLRVQVDSELHVYATTAGSTRSTA